jgi:hypothetical protein
MNDAELEQIGLDAVDRFITTFNSRDAKLWADSLNFPHARPAPGMDTRIIPDAETYINGFDYQRIIDTGWDHSEWDYKQGLHVSDDKIHVAGQWSRYNKAGDKILTTPITYIVTRTDNKWGIQSRFAVDYVEDGNDGEAERPAFKVIEAFVAGYNNGNMKSCATLLNYPHVEINPGMVTRLDDANDFSMQGLGQMQIDSLIAIQAGYRSVNLAIETTVSNDDGMVNTYQGIIQVSQKNDQPGISAWSFIAKNIHETAGS